MTASTGAPGVKRALLSVSDKTGLVPFVSELVRMGVEIIATGGTASLLRENGIAVTPVDAVTGFPEIMDGRVKTLHPNIHAALLARPGIDDEVLAEHNIKAIQLVVVNLYPFAATVSRPGCSMAEAIENIDIGGPCMIRAAAKNHDAVGVVVSPADYDKVLRQLRDNGSLDKEFRQQLALRAFSHTAAYDGGISNYLGSLGDDGNKVFPQVLNMQFSKHGNLRYGENPHQQAALYVPPEGAASGTLAGAKLLQGKHLSFNNYLDADVAYSCASRFTEATVVIVKHGNPCGVASGEELGKLWQAALQCDSEAAFGGIVACNRLIDSELARHITSMFIEVVIAPGVDKDAAQVLAAKKNMRVLVTAQPRPFGGEWELDTRRINGGLLLQDGDTGSTGDGTGCKVAGANKPSDKTRGDLMFAWQVAYQVKSNAIVLARDKCTVGVGAGQMNRADSVRLALQKAKRAGIEVKGAVMASDAFFPFADGVEIAGKAGISAVIQPGGSVRDDEVTAVADSLGMCMLHTGVRHFKH